jgi:hypothetical protein
VVLNNLQKYEQKQLTPYTPLVENRFAPLSKLQEDMHQPSYVQHSYQPALLSKTCDKNQRKICLLGGFGEKKLKKRKIIVLGDSHERGCARELASCLGNKFEVNGTVMPGAGLAHISTLAKDEIRNLTPGDAVVIWGGANDVSRNNSQDGPKSLTL